MNRYEVTIYERVSGKLHVFAETTVYDYEAAKRFYREYLNTLPSLQDVDIDVYEGKRFVRAETLVNGRWQSSNTEGRR